MHSSRLLGRSFSAFLFLFFTSCSQTSGPQSEPKEEKQSEALPPLNEGSVDLASAIEKARHAFRADGGAFRSAGGAHTVRSSGGAFSFTPRIRNNPPADDNLPIDATTTATREARGQKTTIETGAAITFETIFAARESEPNARHAMKTSVDGNGDLRVERGGVVETIDNRREGVEQTFALEKAPEGKGDWIVRVHVSGQRYEGQTEEGLHFRDPSTGIGVRFGRATFIDAAGKRTEVKERFDASTSVIEMRVPDALLAASSFPAVLDPLVSPEILVDEPVFTAQWYSQTRPAVAWDGTQWVAVWQELSEDGSASSLFGVHVDAQGKVVEPYPLVVSPYGFWDERPALAWNGSEWLVVWERNAFGATGWDVYGLRLDAALNAIDAAPIAISTATGGQRGPSVTAAGSSFFVAWDDSRNGAGLDIYAARVLANGSVLDPNGFVISNAANEQAETDVEFDGTNVLVTWHDNRSGTTFDAYAARVNPNTATVLDSNGIVVSAAAQGQMYPALAFDGTNFLVAWRDYRTNSSYDIYGARVSKAGAVLDANGIQISAAAGAQRFPDVAYGNGSFFVVWEDRRSGTSYDVYGARVSSAGAILDPAGIALTTATGDDLNLSVACSTSACLGAWDVQGFGSRDILGARVSTQGTLLDTPPLILSATAKDKEAIGVSFDGTNFLLLVSHTSFFGELYGVRISPMGQIIDATPFPIFLPKTHSIALASIAFDGTNHVVVWEDYRNNTPLGGDLYATRVTPGGVVLDPNGFLVASASGDQSMPSIGCGTGHCLVAWEDNRAGQGDVWGAIIQNGSILTPTAGALLVSANGFQVPGSVTFDGASYLVSFRDTRVAGGSQLYAARVTPQGASLDPTGFPVSTAAPYINWPDATFDGTNHFLVWSDHRNGNDDIYGARISPMGTVLDPDGFPITQTPEEDGLAVVTFDGKYEVVALLRGPNVPHLVGTRVRPSGQVVDTTPFVIDAKPDFHYLFGFASDGAGRSLLPYDYNDASLHAFQPFARIIHTMALGVSCQGDSDCESGSCVDGVCCDTACGGGALDCQACSVAQGAMEDGKCAPLSGTSCDDGNACTQTDLCQAGACSGTNPVMCMDPGPCQAAQCDAATGMCGTSVLPDGSACPGGACMGGVCMPSGSSSSSSSASSSSSSSGAGGSGGSGGGSGGSGGGGGIGGGSGSGGGGGIGGGSGSGSGSGSGGGSGGGGGGSGGSGGSGGAGTGGSAGGGTGGAESSGSSTGSTGGVPTSGGGCDCTITHRHDEVPNALALLGLTGLWAARRRRRA